MILSPEVRDEIEKNKFDLNQSQVNKISQLFTDISDLQAIEGLEPKEVLELLSEYQTKMVAAVFQNGVQWISLLEIVSWLPWNTRF